MSDEKKTDDTKKTKKADVPVGKSHLTPDGGATADGPGVPKS